MKRRLISLTVVVLIVFLSVLVFKPVYLGDKACASSDEWPMFRHDQQHTGSSSTVEIAPPLSLHFTINLGASTNSTPAVAQGKLYIGDDKGFMHCYNADDGVEIWSKSRGDNIPIKSSPAIFDGKVYYGDNYGRFFCLSAENGKTEWMYQTGDKIVSSPLAAVINGKKLVFFGSCDHTIYCLNADSGDVVWQYTTGDSVYSSPVLYKESVIVGSGDGYLYCFDGGSGKIIWKQKLVNSLHFSNKVYSSAAVDLSRQLVFIGSYNHYFYALKAETGEVKWYADMKEAIYASPVIDNNNVFCVSYGKIACFNEDMGKEMWEQLFNGRSLSSPSSEFGYLLLSGKESGFSCLNMQTGEKVWNFEVKLVSKSSPIAVDDHIYFVGDGKIFAFSGGEKTTNPILQVSSKTFDFGELKKGVKASQYLYIKNIYRDIITDVLVGTLQGIITTNSNWISVVPSHFQSNAQTVYVTIDTSNLTEGKSYQGKIYVKTNGGDATIDVTVSISQSPDPIVSTTVSTIDFGDVDKDEIPKTTFYIENSHKDPATGKWIGLLKGTILPHNDWITVTPASFESNKQLVSVSVDTSSLKEGESYKGFIDIKTNGGNISIPISITIKKHEKPVQRIVITLKPGDPYMTVNGVRQEIDPGRGTKPVIIKEWGRTVVPIRAIVEVLGGTISWDGTERKVTINLKETVIELWIDNPKAKVNGETKWIDPKNHSVKPIIVNDRTMLPLRFVAESLGCTVSWDASTKIITITYSG